MRGVKKTKTERRVGGWQSSTTKALNNFTHTLSPSLPLSLSGDRLAAPLREVKCQMQYSASPSVSTPLFSPCLDRCHCRIFMFCKKWAQTQPLANSLTASFLTSVHSLSTLSHHLLHPKFPSLDFPPRVRYFWFKHFFVRPAGQSHNCYQVFNFLTQQISSTHYAHTSARSVKKFLIMFPESLEKAYHKSTIHKKLIMNLFCVLLWCQMYLLQNFTLSSVSGTQFFVQPRIVSVLRHVHHHIPICPWFASKYELPSVYQTSPLDIKEEKQKIE